MNKPILFYDTETTGLPLWHEPSDDPRQPHVVQLAACLVDPDSRHTIQSMDVIIQPDGWEIPGEVAAIHGITTEYAESVGIPEDVAVGLFYELWQKASCRTGHNETFDARIIRIALKRLGGQDSADLWKAGNAQCTARLATPIVNLPPTEKMLGCGRNQPKTPKLSEAYRHFFSKELEGAHSAMVDVRACMDVYWEIQDRLPF